MNCTNCQIFPPARKGRCWYCYRYWRKNGKDFQGEFSERHVEQALKRMVLARSS